MSWIPSPEFLVFLSPSSKSYDVICVYYHNFIGSVCGFVLCVCFMLIIFVSLPILRNMKSVTLVFNQSHRNFFPLNWSLNISWVLVGGGHTPFLNLFVIWFTITWLWLYFKVFCSFLHHINTLPQLDLIGILTQLDAFRVWFYYLLVLLMIITVNK